MRTFQDIIKDYPSVATVNTGVHERGNDMLTRWYNQFWGAITNTNMSLMDDGSYQIEGSILTPSSWSVISGSRVISTAPNTVLPHTWLEVMNLNHMKDEVVNNGQGGFTVVILNSCENKDCQCHHELKIPPRRPFFRNIQQCCNSCPGQVVYGWDDAADSSAGCSNG